MICRFFVPKLIFIFVSNLLTNLKKKKMEKRNFKKMIFTILLISTFVFSCFGQATELRGIVTDEESREPLSEVRIFFNGELQGMADDKGEFTIIIPKVEESDWIRFWKVGHKFQTFEISKIDNKNDMKIKFRKNDPREMRNKNEGGGMTIKGVYLNNERLTEEEWWDINEKEVIDLHTLDSRDTRERIVYWTTMHR